MKLTTTTAWPPDGWEYRDPRTGYNEPMPKTNNFGQVVEGIRKMRENNKGLYKPDERTAAAAAKALEDFTTWRLARRGALEQVVLEPGDEDKLAAAGIQLKKKSRQFLATTPQRPSQPEAGAKPAAEGGLFKKARQRAAQIAGGLATLKDWVGDGMEPIEQETAEARATVCAARRQPDGSIKPCPLNNTSRSFWDWFTGTAIDALKEQLRLKSALALTTKNDDKLGVCEACGCQLHLKVWMPLEYIKRHTSAEVEAKLDPLCWIRKEGSGAAVKKPKGTSLSVQRRGAIGDVVMASGVMKRLAEVADVNFYTAKGLEVLVQGMPFLNKVEAGPWQSVEANLDLSYEKLTDQERAMNPIPEMFMRTAMQALERKGVKLKHPFANLTPELAVSQEECWREKEALEKLGAFRLPVVAVVPRSNSWPCRTINQSSWEAFEREMRDKATLLWTGTDLPPSGYLDMKKRDLRQLTCMLKACDLVVGVDTGPMHLAAGTGTRLVHITQSVAGRMTLPEQRDWTAFNPALDCIACHAWKCPINEQEPPCQTINAEALAKLVMRRLEQRGVSAVIATYKPDPGRINKAIEHLLPQVNEIVVALDGDTSRDGILVNDKIRFVQHFSRKRRGFGKTFNLGARHAHGKWLLSVNDDVFLRPDAVQWMRTTLERDPRAAMTGCLLRYPDGTIQHAGKFRGQTGYGHMDFKKMEPTVTVACETECVTIATAMIRRDAFYEIKGFDERYDCYWEDDDFCLRMRKAGWKVLYEPRATGVHIESVTTKSLNKEQMLHEGSLVFHGLWQWYFDRNKQHGGLGVFA